tara:strand:+ start:816 stop:1460 length:645 start_codon:yes stop_codon:yes gene_type:complete
MPCENCDSTNLKYVPIVNLYECEDCGLLAVSRIFTIRTEKTQNLRANTNRDFAPLDILLNEFDLQDYRNECIKVYNTLNKHLFFRNMEQNIRFTTVAYYVLQKSNAEYNIHKMCAFIGVNKNKVFNNVKKVKHFFYRENNAEEFDVRPIIVVGNELSEAGKKFLTEMEERYTVTRGLYAAILYEYSDLTQARVCEKMGVSLQRLKRHLKVIRNG